MKVSSMGKQTSRYYLDLAVLGKLGPGILGPGKSGPIFCGKLGPGRLGPGKLGPGRLGPGKSGPGRLGPLVADWAPEILLMANRAPANWAPG